MTDIECGYCWRAENLTTEQQLDPANAISGTVSMCERHRRAHEEIFERFGHLMISPGQAVELALDAQRIGQAIAKQAGGPAILGNGLTVNDPPLADVIEDYRNQHLGEPEPGWLRRWLRRLR